MCETTMQKLISEGAVAASSPAKLAEICADKSARAILSMLPEGKHTKEVYLGSQGVLKLVNFFQKLLEM